MKPKPRSSFQDRKVPVDLIEPILRAKITALAPFGPYSTTLHPAPFGFSQHAASFFRLSLNCSSHCALLCKLPGLIQCDCGNFFDHSSPPSWCPRPVDWSMATLQEFMLPMRWQAVQVLPRVVMPKACSLAQARLKSSPMALGW